MTGRELGERFLSKEIEADRRSERWLVLKAVIALAVVGVLVVVRQVFFG
ncbi:hypothetical protein [Antiquaquibacter soli]|uniref:Preprotein translocase subunit SecE n=1 Tax=Antiquaquibacter soli TaxID=3064523 RepID=A0ABT9BK18_9MICO|nr:hypothetical protein [Protaetiibacter sp. WY-16]MDO7881372.1 hypothetical protein [Protaetiibacter sp. WY-16]